VDVGLDGLPLEAEDELPALEPEFELLTLLTALPAENGFADPEPHPTIEATAIAAAPGTRVMRINHARFVYLVSQQPAFALMVMDALSKRLRASNAVNFGTGNP